MVEMEDDVIFNDNAQFLLVRSWTWKEMTTEPARRISKEIQIRNCMEGGGELSHATQICHNYKVMNQIASD